MQFGFGKMKLNLMLLYSQTAPFKRSHLNYTFVKPFMIFYDVRTLDQAQIRVIFCFIKRGFIHKNILFLKLFNLIFYFLV